MSNHQRVAVTHPGKIGDVIYACPTIKWLAKQYGPVDFFTSTYCKPLRELFEYQWWINSFNMPDYYQPDNFGCGGQPWNIPVPGYDKVIHLGFREFPTLPLDMWYYTFLTGDKEYIPPFIGTFDCPESNITQPYIVLAPRVDDIFKSIFVDFINKCPLKVVQIGTSNEHVPGNSVNATGLNLLETAGIISNASGYFGVLSALGGLAQSFDIKKVLLGAGAGWDMRHVRPTSDNFYPAYPPQMQEIFSFLGLESKIMKTYSKTLNVQDYIDMPGHVQHIKNIQSVLSGIPARFEHEHRYWEYALAYKVLDEYKPTTILDVGGGGSVFAPAMAWLGHQVTVVDNGDVGEWIRQQNERIHKNIEFKQEDFMNFKSDKYDVVVCLSVLEHIPNDMEFFNKLLDNVKDGGVLVLTTDFHPMGMQIVGGHLRTYNERMMNNLIDVATKRGFVSLGTPDYSYFEPNVNGCTFASLALKKSTVVDVPKPVKKVRK